MEDFIKKMDKIGAEKILLNISFFLSFILSFILSFFINRRVIRKFLLNLYLETNENRWSPG